MNLSLPLLPLKLDRLVVAVAALLLSACAQQPVQTLALSAQMPDWSARELPGKRATRYSLGQREGRRCLLAQAEQSASLWRRPLLLTSQALGSIEFDWWFVAPDPRSTVTAPESDDAPLRLVLAFDGDAQRLSMRNRMMFELAQTLTGEAPPYATLMYVWDASAAPETIVVSAHSDRVRKIVIGSGTAGAGRWQRFERDVQADFRRAFQEAPGTLVGVAFMTDADNTRGRNEACYGPLLFRDAAGSQSLSGSLKL